MKQLLAFIKKEFYHILRDKRTLVILLGMPVMQILIFGFALTNEVKNAKFVVWDASHDDYTSQIIHEINASSYFHFYKEVHSYSEIEHVFRNGDAKLAIVFPVNFARNVRGINSGRIQLIADASDPNTATTLTSYAGAILRDFQMRLLSPAVPPFAIVIDTRMLYNPQLEGAYNFVPGVMALVLMLICTLMTAITIVREKEMGTMEVLLASPVQPMKIILAKAIPYLLLSFINILTILLLSVYVLDVPVRGNLALLLSEGFLFILTCLAIGMLISTATSSQQTAMFIALIGMFLPTVLLSGFMFPIENMPWPLRLISNIVPAKWFYQIVQAIMIKGGGFAMIWKQTLILLGMTVFFLALSIRNFKIRLS